MKRAADARLQANMHESIDCEERRWLARRCRIDAVLQEPGELAIARDIADWTIGNRVVARRRRRLARDESLAVIVAKLPLRIHAHAQQRDALPFEVGQHDAEARGPILGAAQRDVARLVP